MFRFQPQALNIVNLKGKVVGYCYTGVSSVLMDRKKDGSVTVYPPRVRMNEKGEEGARFPHGR